MLFGKLDGRELENAKELFVRSVAVTFGWVGEVVVGLG